MNKMDLEDTRQPQDESFTLIKPNISNLHKCIEDVVQAVDDDDGGLDDPSNYNQLRSRLEAARLKLPPLYRETVFKPFVGKLDEIGQEGFTEILLRDPERNREAGLLFDIAQAIIQNGEGYHERETDAFQEVVSDLYDGFLSAGDRRGIKPPDKSIVPPLVKWGNPEFGPYTWPVDIASIFGVQTGIVNLPPANAKRGLLAWAALGHETAGHDILHADTGLTEELAEAVLVALKEQNMEYGLPEYWSTRIDETASDVLGILNMGPAAGIGLIGYFRGLNAFYFGKPILRNSGSEDDPHPVDIVRGYLAAETVRLLRFDGARVWGDILESETDKDLSKIQLGGAVISVEAARQSARIVASTLARTKLKSLENHALGQIQNWRNKDERIVKKLRSLLTTESPLPRNYESGIYAAHVVAAAVTEAVSENTDIGLIYEHMITLLKTMHDTNPSWGPLYVVHPGDIVSHKVYSRSVS